MKRISKFFWWINIAIVLLTLLSYLAPYINPQKIWQASFLGLAYPTLLWINLLFIGIWSLTSKKYVRLSLIAVILGWSPLRSLIGINLSAEANYSAQDLRVLSYNTNAMYHIRNQPTKPKQLALEAGFQNFIADQDANIICLQEFLHDWDRYFQDSLRFGQFEKVMTPTGTILSRWPIIQSEDSYFKHSGNGYLWADIKTNFDTIRVFNIHLQSNSISQTTDKVQVTDLAEQETWSTIRGLLAQVNERTLKRVDQARIIADMIEQSPHPVIVAGDFNNTPQSYSFKLISDGLVDSFREKGLGLGTTYAGKIPNLRIDFILSDQTFDAVSSEVLEAPYSDHYPLVSTFSRRP